MAAMFSLMHILPVFLLMLISGIPAAYSENVITIIPCSSNHNNPKFFDMPFYFIGKGQQVLWHNADDINHRLIITNSSGKGLLSDSSIIKSNGSFSFRFNKIGVYHYLSAIYPWMRGNVSVTNDIASETVFNPKSSVGIQLLWTPSMPKAGELTHFEIIFINKETGKNQQHVDYVFSITNPANKIFYQQALHSSWGVESASYKFQTVGIFIPKVTIDALLFSPVEPIEGNFKILVKA
jgi:plastocyanin